MKKKLKWIALVLVAGFALLQLTNPARTNPPVVRDLSTASPPPPQINTLLHNACYDCHSYETKWPLYSRLAPSSWLVVRDVNEGREHLNFSDWPQDPARVATKLNHISDQLDDDEMPPKKYTLLHPEARLTETQRKAIMDWSDTLANQLHPATN